MTRVMLGDCCRSKKKGCHEDDSLVEATAGLEPAVGVLQTDFPRQIGPLVGQNALQKPRKRPVQPQNTGKPAKPPLC